MCLKQYIMTPLDVLLAIFNVVLTSALTAGFVFLSFRWILGKVFNPMISAGASVLGMKSGDNRATRAVANEAAQQFLSGPKMAGLKMIASQLGFDIESMVEEHGAVNTLMGLQQIAGMLGIDIMQIAEKGLGGLTKGLNTNRSDSEHISALSKG